MTKIGVMLEQFIGQCYSKWSDEQQQKKIFPLVPDRWTEVKMKEDFQRVWKTTA